MEDKYFKLVCPKCGYEYVAAEIFYPETILGEPKDIIRDDNNKIISISGNEPVDTEFWHCYGCGCDFQVKLKVEVETIYDKNLDFSEDYSID